MKKIIFNFDMDDVVFGWTPRLLSLIRIYMPHLPSIDRKLHQHWYVENNYPLEFREEINSLRRQKGFYLELELIPGAKEAYQFLLDEGHIVNFVSTPASGITRGDCMKEKHESLERHFGSKAADSLVLTHDKTIIMGHYLIDDKPEIKGSYQPVFNHLVFDEGFLYNSHIPAHRKINWERFPEKISKVIERHSLKI